MKDLMIDTFAFQKPILTKQQDFDRIKPFQGIETTMVIAN